ncbi:hypothetical protein C2E20_3404 [Micractinium conductrix]|uniref:Uncharacterized protein n=1 Tax=Micractinium conductrix TaxID=554055 RepID=A0A2P6VGP8_9CHLO|nr:hypothetical protein C2E20_3404 [Micractinium conductrix]|eukprot:PSC73266.1 hypothetical protein C2E20_3404 [Micractinium conductrix]
MVLSVLTSAPSRPSLASVPARPAGSALPAAPLPIRSAAAWRAGAFSLFAEDAAGPFSLWPRNEPSAPKTAPVKAAACKAAGAATTAEQLVGQKPQQRKVRSALEACSAHTADAAFASGYRSE